MLSFEHHSQKKDIVQLHINYKINDFRLEDVEDTS